MLLRNPHLADERDVAGVTAPPMAEPEEAPAEGLREERRQHAIIPITEFATQKDEVGRGLAGHDRLPERATDRSRVPPRLVRDIETEPGVHAKGQGVPQTRFVLYIAQHDRGRPRVRIGVAELERHLQRGLVEGAEIPAQALRAKPAPIRPQRKPIGRGPGIHDRREADHDVHARHPAREPPPDTCTPLDLVDTGLMVTRRPGG